MSDFAVGVYTTLTVFLVLAVTLGGILYIELRHKVEGIAGQLADVLEQVNDGDE